MDDSSMTNSAAIPGESGAAAKEVRSQDIHTAGGNALLSGQVAASETQNPQGKAESDPIATNASEGNPARTDSFDTTGAYPPNLQDLEEDGLAPMTNLQDAPES